MSFFYAGVDKLVSPGFLDPDAPGSLHATLVAIRYRTPLGSLIGVLTPHAVALGVAIGSAELAVGLAILVGLWTRYVALGGLLLNVIFGLTVNWHTSPWYENPDIVYIAAWFALALASPLPLSLDAWVRARGAEPGVGAASHQPAEEPAPAPVVGRRAALTRLGALGGLVVVGGAGVAAARLGGRSGGAEADLLAKERVPAPRGAPVVVTDGAVPRGQAMLVADTAGSARWLVHTPEEGFVALGTLCTHAFCPVQFLPGFLQLGCPCHGSVFDARTGDVVSGPATVALPRYPVQIRDGKVSIVPTR